MLAIGSKKFVITLWHFLSRAQIIALLAKIYSYNYPLYIGCSFTAEIHFLNNYLHYNSLQKYKYLTIHYTGYFSTKYSGHIHLTITPFLKYKYLTIQCTRYFSTNYSGHIHLTITPSAFLLYSHKSSLQHFLNTYITNIFIRCLYL